MFPRTPALLLVAALAACSSSVTPGNPFDGESASPRPGRLEGQVVGEAGLSATTAKVGFRRAGQAAATTIGVGEDGGFGMELAPGDYTLALSAAGFESQDVPGVRVTVGTTTQLGRFVLRIARGTLSGTVSLETGASPEGAVVSFLPQDGQPAPAPLVVDGSGRWTQAGVATGTYLVRASKAEYVPVYSEAATVVASEVASVPALLLSDGSAVLTRKVDDGGDPRFVRVREVTLVLATFGELMKSMRVSEDPTFRDEDKGDVAWRPYLAEVPFTLVDQDGDHVVYATFKDRFDLETPPFRVALVLDREPPAVPRVQVGDGSGWVRDPSGAAPTLIGVTDDRTGVAAVRTAVDADVTAATWSPVETQRLDATLPAVSLALGGERGARVVWVQVRDRAGNESEPVRTDVRVDSTAPAAASATPVTVAGGGLVARDTDLALALAVSGDTDEEPLFYAAANGDAVPEGATWLALGKDRVVPFTLDPDADGEHVVTVRVRDEAGNVSEPLQATLTLDRTGGIAGKVSLRGAPGPVTGVTVTLTNAVDATFSRATVAAADGRFAFEGVPAAKAYVLAVARSGYRAQSVPGVEVVAGRTLTVPDVALDVAKGSLRGQAVLADRAIGESGGVSVYATQTPYATVTSPTGDFTLELPVGTYEIAARATGYLAGSFGSAIAVTADETKDLGHLDLRKQSGQFAICKGTDTTCAAGAVEFTGSRDVRLKLDSTTAAKWRAGLTNPPTGDFTAFTSATTYPFTLAASASPGDGAKVIYVQYQASNGDVLSVLAASVTLDTTPPQLNAVWVDRQADGRSATYTNDATGKVILTLDATDAGSGLATVTVSNEDTQFDEQPGPYATQVTHFVRSQAEGTKKIYLQLVDRVGNATATPAQPSATIVLDRQPPSAATGAAITIASVFGNTVTEDAALTTNTGVRLKIVHGDAVAVRFGASETLTSAAWQTLSGAGPSFYEYTLSAGDGTKTVYAQFADAAGNVSSTSPAAFSDTIVLDQTAPTGAALSITGTAGVAPANGYTNAATVPLTLAASGATQMEVLIARSESFTGAWETFNAAKSAAFPVGATDGTWGIYARFRDAAGNVATATSLQIIRDTVAPAAGPAGGGAPVAIRQDSSGYVTTTGVNATFNITGADEMGVQCNGSGSTSGYVSYVAAWACSATTPGPQTVTATFRDRAGNTYSPGAVTVTYDAVAPGAPTVSAVPLVRNALPFSLSWTPGTNSTDVSKWRVQLADNPSFAPVAGELSSGTTSLSITDWSQGTYYWRVYGIDAAGNVGATSTNGVFDYDSKAPGTADVRVTAITETTATLEWNAPGDDAGDGSLPAAASFEVRFQAGSSSFSWSSATPVTPAPAVRPLGQLVTTTVTGLQKETNYQFAVRTTDEAGNVSDVSTPVRASTPDTSAPDAVTNLTAARATGKVTLTWTEQADDGHGSTAAARQYVYYREGTLLDERDFAQATLAEGPTPKTPGATVSFDVTGLRTNGSYAFAVRTLDEAGNLAPPSNVVVLNYTPISAVRPSSAAVGDLVELDGMNLGTVVGDVIFGGTRATNIVSWTDSIIVAEVPAGAQSGPVQTLVAGRTSDAATLALAPQVWGLYAREHLIDQPTFLSGTNFGQRSAASTLVLGKDVEVTSSSNAVSEWVDDAITFTQPSSGLQGLYPVRVDRGGAVSRSTPYRAWRNLGFSPSAPTGQSASALAIARDTNDLHLLAGAGTSFTHRVADLDVPTPQLAGAYDVSTGLSGFATLSADIDADAQGLVHTCLIVRDGASKYWVYYRRRSTAGVWTTPVNLGPTAPVSNVVREDCRIAGAKNPLTSALNVLVVWTERAWTDHANHSQLHYSYTGDGGTTVGVRDAALCPTFSTCTNTSMGRADVGAWEVSAPVAAYITFPIAYLSRTDDSDKGAVHLTAISSTFPTLPGTVLVLPATSTGVSLAALHGRYPQAGTPLLAVAYDDEVDVLTRYARLYRSDAGFNPPGQDARISTVVADQAASAGPPALAVTRDGDLSLFVAPSDGGMIRHHLYRTSDRDLPEDSSGEVVLGLSFLGSSAPIISAAGGPQGSIMVAYTGLSTPSGAPIVVSRSALPYRETTLGTALAASNTRLAPVTDTDATTHGLYFEQNGTTATLRSFSQPLSSATATVNASALDTWTETLQLRSGLLCDSCPHRTAVVARPTGKGSGVWVTATSPNKLQYCADLSACSTPTTLATAAAGRLIYAPDLALDATGLLHVTWESNTFTQNSGTWTRTGSGTIHYLTVSTSGVASTAVQVSSEPGSCTEPAVAVPASRTAHVVYRRQYGGDTLRLRTIAPGRASPGAAEDLVRDAFPLDKVRAAFSPRGLELAWRRSNRTLYRGTWRYGWIVEPEVVAGGDFLTPTLLVATHGQAFIGERSAGTGNGGPTTGRLVAADDLLGEWGSPRAWGEISSSGDGAYSLDRDTGRLVLHVVKSGGALSRLVYYSLGK